MAAMSTKILLFVLACICQANSPTASQISAEGSARLDLASDPYEKMVVAAFPGAPTSDLFGSCLAAAREMEVKLYSIEPAMGFTYYRYVPSDAMIADVNPTWNIVSDIDSIQKCAAAALDATSSMFDYQNGICRIIPGDGEPYDIEVDPGCSDENDAVFVFQAAGDK